MNQDSSEINFSTYSGKWYVILFIVCSGLVSLLVAVSDIDRNAKGFIWIAAITAIFLGSKYYARGAVSIRTQDDTFVFETKLKHFGDQFLEISKTAIRGYEITTTKRGQNDLIFYFTDFSFIRYPINDAKQIALINDFLGQELPVINSSSNQRFRTFLQAFIFALKRIFLNLILILAIAAILNSLKSIFDASSKLPMILVLLIAPVLWKFLVRDAIRKAGFRFNAFTWAYCIFLLFSLILLFPLSQHIHKLVADPVNYDADHGSISNFNSPLLIKNVSYRSKNSYGGYEIGSSGYKSLNFPVYYYWLTPINTKGKGIWILQKKKGWIRKGTPVLQAQEKIKQYGESIIPEFERNLKRSPVFYLLLYSDVASKNEYSYVRSLVITVGEAIILEPHWESIAQYQNKLILYTVLLIMGIVVVQILFALAMAYNR